MKTSNELRQAFLDYFAEREHVVVPSSPLIPANDPTLLFTNAGMVQFKDTFLGHEQRDYSRVVSSQRCVRAGGKHNDLENVGHTARHHTFFEMLGNFSFGDYFKREAIQFAWEFLTEVLGLPEERLWVTVYTDDDEAADIWLKEMKVSPDRFSRCGEDDNFWSMGDIGPCGPCSEIFYDHGDHIPGGPPGSPEQDADRYVEIWNLVFMQYNRDKAGKLTPLPKPSVDTGMGLERLAAVMQGVHNNYDTDLFQPIIKAAAKLAKVKDLQLVSLKVIADHIRASSFLITDGVVPSNEGRGYVLRRIIRRAARHGHQLGMTDPFMYRLVSVLVEMMGEAYPELTKSAAHIERLLKLEEEQFGRTLNHGMCLLEDAIKDMSGKEISGELAFKLYDTYGFPLDLTADIAREQGLTVDQAEFDRCLAAQRAQSQANQQFNADYYAEQQLEGQTDFTGYEAVVGEATVTAIYQQGQAVESLAAGQSADVVLDVTPFYAESGGQVGDTGELRSGTACFQVFDTTKQQAVFLHHGELLTGELRVGDKVNTAVDATRRQAIVRNHSATHLMHAALRQVLGEHVVQKGSLVDAEHLRFDFAHYQPVSQAELLEIEHLVNAKIRENLAGQITVTSPDKAKDMGALALFGEKYGDEVRVLSLGDFSIELCGGTHVGRTGDIGFFKITSESGIAAGIRRIDAVTGEGAEALIEAEEAELQELAAMLKTDVLSLPKKLQQTLQRQKQLERQLEELEAKLATSASADLASQAVDVNGVTVLAAQLSGGNPKALRDTLDQLKQKLGSAVIVLGLVSNDRVNLIAGVTKDLVGQFHAGNIVKHVAEQVGGKGGGRPDMAQAGGSDVQALPAALESVAEFIRS